MNATPSCEEAVENALKRPLARLYHFTCLCYLPLILRDGIQKGEVPVGVYPRNPNAANLTGYGDRKGQEWFKSSNILDKTKVRLTVEVPHNDITSFEAVASDYSLTEAWIMVIDPLKHRDRWYFAFDGVSPENIVEVALAPGASSEYELVPGETLESLLADIEKEQQRAGIVMTPKGAMCEIHNVIGSWLFDGPGAKALRRDVKRRANERKQRSLDKRAKRRLRKLTKNQNKRNR